jgi:hypothetical protein
VRVNPNEYMVHITGLRRGTSRDCVINEPTPPHILRSTPTNQYIRRVVDGETAMRGLHKFPQFPTMPIGKSSVGFVKFKGQRVNFVEYKRLALVQPVHIPVVLTASNKTGLVHGASCICLFLDEARSRPSNYLCCWFQIVVN